MNFPLLPLKAHNTLSPQDVAATAAAATAAATAALGGLGGSPLIAPLIAPHHQKHQKKNEKSEEEKIRALGEMKEETLESSDHSAQRIGCCDTVVLPLDDVLSTVSVKQLDGHDRDPLIDVLLKQVGLYLWAVY